MIKMTIGTAPTNNIVLNHPSVSPVHLEIVQDDQGNFLLTDYNSQYGTFVNGYRVQGIVQLRPTDVVNAGQVPLPWRNYFMYQTPPPNTNQAPQTNYVPPVFSATQNPQYGTIPADTNMPPVQKPKNKKKIIALVGGSVLLVVLIIIAFLYFYTRPSYVHLKYIPSNAFVVSSINFKNISEKIDVDKMQKLDFYMDMKDHARDENEILSKAMSEPLSSGVDIFSQPYAFACFEGNDSPQFSGGIVFSIKNEDDFHKFVMRLSKNSDIRSTGNYNYLDLESGSCIAWNKAGGIIYYSDRSSSRKENYCKSLLEQDADASILSVESFDKFKNAKYDIGFFVNFDGIHSIPGVTLPSYMRGASTMATIDFNDGKLSYASEFFPSKSNTSANTSNFFGQKGINDELKNSIPGNAYGVATMSIDLKALYDYMNKDSKMSEGLDEMARELDIDRTQLAGILSGEAYLALADIKQTVKEKQDMVYDYESDQFSYTTILDTVVAPSLIFGITVNDTKTIDRIINRSNPTDTTDGIKSWDLFMMGNYYVTHHGANYFISNDFDIAQQLNSNIKATNPLTPKMSDVISNDPLYTYFNLNITKYPAVLPQYLESKMGKRENEIFNTFISMFDYVELTGNGVKQNLDVYFTDKGNCLNTFMKVGNDIYVQNMHR